MNKTKAGISLTLLFFVFSGFASVAHAATCTPPTPPACYQSVPLYSNTGFQSDGAIVSSDGQTVVLPNGYGNAVPNSKKVPVACPDNGSSDPTYNAEKLAYAVCTQTSNPSYDASGNRTYCFAPTTQDCDPNVEGGLAELNNMHGTPEFTAGEVQACADRHAQYQKQLTTYNACLNSQVSSQPSSKNYIPPANLVPATPPTNAKKTASCQEQHGIHSVTDGEYCTCPLVGYDFDSNGQCIASGTTDDSKKVLNPSLVTADMLKNITKIFQSYYPDAISTLTKSAQEYNTGDKNTTLSLFAIEKIFQTASNNSADLNNTYRDKNISKESSNAIYDLKESITVCLATSQVMLKNDSLDIVQAGLKKCTGWSATLNSALSQSSVAIVPSDKTQTSGDIAAATTSISPTPIYIAINAAPRSATTKASPSSVTTFIATTTEVLPRIEQLQKAWTEVSSTPSERHWYDWFNPFNWFK